MSARIELFPERAGDDHFEPDATGFQRYVLPGSLTGRWYWRLVGGNGETIATSEAYTRKASAKRGARRAMSLMRYLESCDFPGCTEPAIVEVSR